MPTHAFGDAPGGGVNVAAWFALVALQRQELAEPGGICVTRTVSKHVKGRVDSGFVDLDEEEVKNNLEPVRVFRDVSLGLW